MTVEVTQFAFWGRCSTEDRQDPEASRAWQYSRAGQLVAPRGGVIVSEYFDVDKSRSIPPARRPQASHLLAELANPGREFDAVVVGEPQRAFYGNQFGNTFPLFEHWDVPLWVPEVGGPIDPANEAHDMIMSTFGSFSKGERSRIKTRVRTTMAALAQTQGRYLGGRPPYGYRLIDAGPHPNPAKAADGKRLHALAIDEPAAAVAQRIFAEFLAGHGIYAIAERLTADGIPCPSAHDPARNRHRCGIAWSKYAVRAILTNPRYTGRQVWNRQRKDEVLIDVNDVALGHLTKMRWNDADKWIYSDQVVHPPIIDDETFRQSHALLTARQGVRAEHKPHRSKRPYALRGLLFCGICDRRMQGHWANGAPYYRCRFPNEYALANRVRHPLNVTLRQDAILAPLDAWLAQKFAPRHLAGTIEELAAAAAIEATHEGGDEVAGKIAQCNRRLAQYRATLDAGGDPAVVARWITETEAERAKYQAMKRPTSQRPPMSREEIASIVNTLADLRAVVHDADPADKAEIYAQLGLKLTYQPQSRTVRAEARLSDAPHWYFESVRGGT